MSTSGPTNAQARRLLQTLCKFLIPLSQLLDMDEIKNMDDIPLGVEADEFISELENFLLSAQQRRMNESLQVTLDPLDYVEGIEWRADQVSSLISETEVISADFKENSDNLSKDVALYKQPSKKDLELQQDLAGLRERITRYIPIRVLHFEPFGSKLNISLLDRNAIYGHLSQKLLSDFNEAEYDRDKWQSDHTQYAILSHTWKQTPGELTYVDWQKGQLDLNDPKCQKLINFCKAAWEHHGLIFGWIDTVCINKESSSELDESIRSMYKWYRNAAVCITYLAETNSLLNMHHDPWFTRGWTLQELIAPRVVKFYDKSWEQLIPSDPNDKIHQRILDSIESATTIAPNELDNIYKVPISRRMELAARRNVTREEDTAYSLMGIFDVSISTAYGEGAERAFFRLLKEIFDTNKDVSDIFNWGGYFTSTITSLFPEDIHRYANRSTDPKLRPWRPIEPLTLTHVGLRMLVLLMSAELRSELDSSNQPVGEYHAAVSIQLLWEGPETYRLLQTNDFTNAMGVLNVEENDGGNSIRIPKTCFAVSLEEEQDGRNNLGRYKKINTRDPIVFSLEKVSDVGSEDNDYYVVKKDQLENHGMKLVTLYL